MKNVYTYILIIVFYQLLSFQSEAQIRKPSEPDYFYNSLVLSINGDINISQTDYMDASPGRGFLFSAEYHLQAIGNTSLGFNVYAGREFLYGKDQWKIPESFRTDLRKLGFGMMFTINVTPAFYPYISTGISAIWMKTESDGIKRRKTPSEVNRSFAFDGIMGMRLAFSHYLIFDFNGGIHFLPMDKLDDTEIGIHNDFYITISAGISFAFPLSSKDSDKDGIKDKDDLCDEQPEDFDGFEDNDGCPDNDNDRDGIADINDKCKNDPEDKDGFEDYDGCPDPDNDNDGIADQSDKCPDEAEDFDNFEDYDGCPEADNDRDGIADKYDKCPDEPETMNAYNDNDGCPDIKPAPERKIKEPVPDVNAGTPKGIVKGGEKTDAEEKPAFRQIVLHGELTFTRDGTQLLPEALPGLKNIARQMKSDVNGRWQIAGYMDNQGDEKELLEISHRRAAAIKSYLVSQGVPARKLTAVGMGSKNPVDTNDKVYGRMMNRRIVITRIR